jgi:integrase/recombinase XerD
MYAAPPCYMMRLMVDSRPGPPNKGKTYPPEPLTPAEVSAIIGRCSQRAPTGIRNRAMLWLAYRSGLRISELLALRPVDLNFADHSARVLHGKGNKATVRYWHPSADDALQRWLDERKRRGLARPGGRLFCTLDGGPVSDDYVRNLLRRLAAGAGIEKRVHPHGLRHSYAVELRKAGMDVAAISKLLGHSSIAVTARYLDHLTNDEAGKALERIELPAL